MSQSGSSGIITEVISTNTIYVHVEERFGNQQVA